MDCQFCGLGIAFFQHHKHHQEECTDIPLECPCGESFRRCDLPNHLTSCPEQVVECVYRSIGCNEKFKRCQEHDHTVSAMNLHNELLLSTVVGLRGDLSNQTTLANNTCKQLTESQFLVKQLGKKVELIERSNSAVFTWRVTGMQDKIQFAKAQPEDFSAPSWESSEFAVPDGLGLSQSLVYLSIEISSMGVLFLTIRKKQPLQQNSSAKTKPARTGSSQMIAPLGSTNSLDLCPLGWTVALLTPPGLELAKPVKQQLLSKSFKVKADLPEGEDDLTFQLTENIDLYVHKDDSIVVELLVRVNWAPDSVQLSTVKA